MCHRNLVNMKVWSLKIKHKDNWKCFMNHANTNKKPQMKRLFTFLWQSVHVSLLFQAIFTLGRFALVTMPQFPRESTSLNYECDHPNPGVRRPKPDSQIITITTQLNVIAQCICDHESKATERNTLWNEHSARNIQHPLSSNTKEMVGKIK